MTVTRRELEPFGVRIVGIAAIAHDEVTIATIHHNCIEAHDTTIASAAGCTFFDFTTSLSEESIDDFHLRYEALRIDDEIGFAAVIVDGKLPCDTRSLRQNGGRYEREYQEGDEG